jgi:hypothetical protein
VEEGKTDECKVEEGKTDEWVVEGGKKYVLKIGRRKVNER